MGASGATRVREMTWVEEALCRGADPEQFFQRGKRKSRPAIQICERCQVRQQCLEYALREGIELGVWGGLTSRQRRAVLAEAG